MIAWKTKTGKNLNKTSFEIELERILHRWINLGFNE